MYADRSSTRTPVRGPAGPFLAGMEVEREGWFVIKRDFAGNECLFGLDVSCFGDGLPSEDFCFDVLTERLARFADGHRAFFQKERFHLR